MDHYADGLFDNAPTTTWTRGKAEPVYWTTGAGHEGGYAYRLCKIPPGGVTQITEECFNQGKYHGRDPIISVFNLFFPLFVRKLSLRNEIKNEN